MGLRTRLFVMTVALLALFGGLGTWWTSVRMRAVLTEDVQWQMLSHGEALAALLDGHGELEHVVQVVARASDARVTVVGIDGTVLADSEVPDLAAMDNHGARPEVRLALGPEAKGIASRYSHTLQQQMLYVAVPWRVQGVSRGVVRLARPLDRVEVEVGRLPKALGIAGVFALGLSALLAWVFSEFATRDLRQLVVRVRTLAGQHDEVDGDEIARLTGSVDRISDALQQAVNQVAEERTQLQALLSGMREAVLSLDSEGRVKNTNPAAKALFGIGPAAVGQPFEAVMRQPELVAAVDEARQNLKPGLVELSLPTPGAVARELVATIAPLADGGTVLVMHDQTEIRRLESVRRKFVANVSHELRTPVAVISSSVEALIDGASGDPVHGPRFRQAIARHAVRLGLLIADLLDLASIEAGERTLKLAPVGVNELATSVMEQLRPRADGRQQILSVDVDAGIKVQADVVALEQVLINLVDNAIKYSPEGGEISVVAEVDGRRVRIEVVDAGAGVPVQHRQRVFERFYRMDPGRTRDMGGTGLGLSIVKHLVVNQGGEVAVVPNRPVGSRFQVWLGRGW